MSARFIIIGGCQVVLIVLALIAPSIAQQSPSNACAGETIGDVSVATVLDGRTFATTDGRTVRLAALEAPPSKAALEALIGGKAVTLKRLGTADDRYGRIVAYVDVQNVSVQQALLSAGAAYVAARVGAKPCADALFAAEKVARGHERGVWADPELGPKSAANRDEILRAKGRFTLVEGKVLSVRETGAAIYINFGTRYTRDFSVLIQKRNASRFAPAPKLLQDKRIRVRGVVEERGGPLIEAERPEQIELIE